MEGESLQGWWEPYEARVSRTVLRERGGIAPPRHSRKWSVNDAQNAVWPFSQLRCHWAYTVALKTSQVDNYTFYRNALLDFFFPYRRFKTVVH